ncbi:3-deoxy-D-manno-octulosonic acid transferase [Planctomicrobium sp. SH668]|uniref:3-deoxy-D-manno-octulosonic acid transferase n=1 Tax=Planctomicrobium sp. SH668 TaxID=3448126 RepID=UPI003F5B7868
MPALPASLCPIRSGKIVLSLVLNLCYGLLVILALPMVIWKRVRTGKYKIGWGQKLLGRLPTSQSNDERIGPRIWLHAVSVGEVLQLRQIVDHLQVSLPDVSIFISTTTETGYAVAKEKLTGCDVGFFPLDFSWAVRNALRRVRPDMIVLVELEIWPNFILTASRLQIPLVLINGRLSEKSFKGYSKLGPLIRRIFSAFTAIGVQTEEYRDRFCALGANAQTTCVTGSIKFDGVATNPANPVTLELRNWLQFDESSPIFVAGSTQAPEERYALSAYLALIQEFPCLRMIIVPRHPERGRELVEMIRQSGVSVLQRSSRELIKGSCDIPAIGLLDTVGELGACWGLADIAFVGGSFTNRGGQNMLEPAAFGAAVCFGPNTWNFKQIVELLLAQNASRRVQTEIELENFVRAMLTDQPAAEEMGRKAKELVLSQKGATERTIRLILNSLPANFSRHPKQVQ